MRRGREGLKVIAKIARKVMQKGQHIKPTPLENLKQHSFLPLPQALWQGVFCREKALKHDGQLFKGYELKHYSTSSYQQQHLAL